MRRVPSETNVQGERERHLRRRGEIVGTSRERRRRLALERLENRELLAVVPTPITSGPNNIGDQGRTTAPIWDSAPSIAINPNNPSEMVSVWGTVNTSVSPAAQGMRMSYSSDGGQTWSAPTVAISTQIDPTTGTSPAPYPLASDAQVAWDRNNHFYVTLLQHNTADSAGELDLRKYNWTGANPTPAGAANPIFQWNRTITQPVDHTYDQGIINYSFGVDNNLSSYTDPLTGATQTDPTAGSMYIAATFDSPIASPPPIWTNYSIHLMSSVDGGTTWNGNPLAGLDQSLKLNSNPNINAPGSPSLVTRPRLAISQGNVSGSVIGGQVTTIWDDYARGSSVNVDVILSRVATVNGSNVLTAQGGPKTVTSTYVRGALSAPYTRAAGEQSPMGVGPSAEIAADNTLGSFSANEGTIYVAYVSYDQPLPPNPVDNTNIALAASTDGGKTWSVVNNKVNNDSAFTDGKSGGATVGDVQSGLSSQVWGRTQFMPSIAVDQYTGAVGMAWYDARDDAANARVAYYMGVSIDGGQTFSNQTYANGTAGTVIDAITGLPVTLGPLPDNQSPGALIDTNNSFGDHQGLAMANGVLHPIWSGNENGGHNAVDYLTTYTSTATYARGPRVIANTSGQVGPTSFTNPLSGNVTTWNDTTTSDGRPILDAFSVTFDRPVAISSFTPSQVQVWYQSVVTPTPTAGISIPVASVVPLDNDSEGRATTFLIRLDRATMQSIYKSTAGGVGTYSYSIGTSISDLVRYQSLTNPVLNQVGNQMDQSGDGVSGGATNYFSAPTSKSGMPFQAPYVTSTLPLIVPGPHVSSSNVPGSAPSVDNLVTDNKVSKIDVTFDRDMQTSTLTPDKVLNILGPAGQVIVPQTFTASGVNANVVIPDNPSKPLLSTISVPTNNNSFPIAKLTVTVNINHMQDSDLKLELIAPDGTTITLADGVGGTGQNFSNTVFDDASKILINAGAPNAVAPFTGTYAPQYSLTPGQGLAAFIGKQVQGAWTLRVTDKNANNLTGVLNGWSMTATPSPTITVGPQTFTSSDSAVNTPIAEGPLMSPITIPSNAYTNAQITHLTVSVSITHPQDSDLRLELIGPGGQTVLLADSVGGSAANFTNTTFDDSAGTAISSGSAPFTGSFQPAQSLYGTFGGLTMAGTWTLKVTDKNGNGLTGTLVNWSLNATTTQATSTVSTIGNIDLQPGVQVTSPVTFAPTLYSGTTISNVAVQVNAQNGDISQLRLDLIGPNGVVVPLSSGAGVSGPSFTGTTFDSTAANSITTGTSPYSAVFKPVGDLSVLNGLPLSGTWSLRFTDSRTIGPVYLNNSWSLSVTGSGVSYGSGTVNSAIPDGSNAPASIASQITIPAGTYANSLIQNLSVAVNISHTRDSDLRIELVGPDGTTITLADGVGGSGQDFSTVFNDSASTPISAGTAPFSGTYQPQGLLSTFNGKSMAGTWTLKVTDKYGNGFFGTLRNWSLGATTASATPTFSATGGDINLALPASSQTTSNIVIPPTSAPNTSVDKMVVSVGLTHPDLSYLQLDLIAPDNTVVPLVAAGVLSGTALTNTQFDDAATQSLASGTAPYTGVFLPASPLSALNGKMIAGTWSLRITDTRTSGVAGTLLGWSMGITGSAVSGLNNTLTAIPDGNVSATPTSVPISIPASPYANSTITGATVTVNIDHAQASDLRIELIAPDGTSTLLANGTAVDGQNVFTPATLNGMQAQGLWTLKVTDQNGNNVTGQLGSWKLDLTTTGASTGTFAASGANLNVSTFPFSSTSSYLTVPAGMDPGTLIGNITVKVSLIHPADNGVALSLIAPDGTVVPLSTGAGVSGANFTSTVFSDSAASSITTGTAPYTGTFKPIGTLASLNGKSFAGQWALQVTDSAGAFGQIKSWSINVTGDNTVSVYSGQNLANGSPIQAGPVVAPITIPANSYTNAPLTGLTVNVTLTHQQDSDVKIELVSPGGQAITLADGVGGSGQNFTNTTFSDSGATSITAGTAPFTGTYQPQTALSTFNGLPLAGTWSLRVTDKAGNALTGSLVNWSITGTTAPTTASFPATGSNTNVSIPAGTQTLSTITIPASSDVGSVISKLTVNLTMTHPSDPSVTLELIAPNGIVVPLAQALSGSNFTNTTFDDSASTSISSGTAPYTGSFRPVSALYVLNNLSFAGTWTLRITDSRSSGTAGNLVGWSLGITTASSTSSSGTLNTPIADGSTTAAPLYSPIVVPAYYNTFPISNLTVSLNLSDTIDSNYKVQLIGPDGTQVTLAEDVGGNGSGFTNTVFDSTSPLSISSGSAPFTGTFAPVQSLAIFNGKSLAGTWLLKVTDKYGKDVTGVLNGWSLTATPVAGASIPYAKTFTIGFPEQVLRGTYTFSLDPNIRSGSGETGSTAADIGAKLDTNQNAGVSLLFQQNPAGANANAQSYSNTVITPLNSSPVNSTIAVPQGTVSTIAHLSVRMQINNAFFNNGSIALVAPDGTTVTLANGLNGFVSFTATTFDDNGPISIASGSSPYANTYQPTQPLSAFIGKSFIGNWNLRVTGAATGSLINWSLTSTLPLGIYNSSNTPQPVAPATAGVPVTPSITWSPLQPVTDNFVIQAATVSLGITYPNDPDLTGTLLVFPTGVDVSNPNTGATPIYTIHLFTNVGNVGATGTRQNFTNTVFDDAATTPIQNGGPPFNGRFNPQTPLSVLVGQNASQYQYVLELTNSGTSAGSLDRWSLSLSKATPNTGLGETVPDRATVSLRLFSMDPTKPLSSSEWSPVGPAGVTSGLLAGSMTAIAVDPTDPSGNTVFVGAASGGVWKTTNFLTSDPQGPTYIPLTDFGPTSGLNTGSIALFPRNNDTSQTVVMVGTGDPSMQFGSPMGGVDTSKGVGFLRSMDGGVTWTVLDSLNNVDSNGNLLPLSQRKHEFVGMTIDKVLIDPKLSVSGQMIMYAAVSASSSNPNPSIPAGIYRSLDGGMTWQLKLAGNATDLLFDTNSGTVDAVSNPAGNYRVLFAAISGQGVYRTANQGDRWDPMTGGVGDPLIQDDSSKNPIPVLNNPTVAPGQRIVLARPALTGNPNQDVQYENWLFAAVTSSTGGPNGTFTGLYVTKDLGQNWTKVSIGNQNQVAGSADLPVPSNNILVPQYDVTASSNYQMGLYNVSLAVDPTNPEIVYLGGTRLSGNSADGLNHSSALIRIDITGLHDPHAFFTANDQPDGGKMTVFAGNGAAGISAQFPNSPAPYALGTPDRNPYINLVRDPNQPFLANSTIYVHNTSAFTNDGAGATWTSLDVDPNGNSALQGSGGLHQILTVTDPLTGLPRLIIADDQGIFSGIDQKGYYLPSIGSRQLPLGSRNGNLQTAQFYYGASQPSSAAAQAAQALFYAQSHGTGYPASNPNIITPGTAGYGDLQWSAAGIGYGVGVATDQTGTGTVYKYKIPGQINDGLIGATSSVTDFFRVQPNGGTEVSRTFNLIQSSSPGLVPDGQWPFKNATGQSNIGNFAVNPLTGNQIIIGSGAGRLFGTENQGQFWNVLANPGDLDGTYVQAPVYGAPDPNGPGVPGALDNYLLAGTVGGHVYATFNGGGTGGSSNNWFNISKGLVNNDPIMQIITDPTRGSHDAYAVSSSHVYYIANTSAKDANGNIVGSGWVDITGDLFSQKINAFGDPNLQTQFMTPNSLTSIAADWRYVIPNTPPTLTNPTPPTHPMLYVGGLGGVVRSSNGINGSANWSVFPDMSLNSPQQNGGMASVGVTSLSLALGNINPTTGRPDVSTGPNVLYATTYGRGSYAIKLAPIVFTSTVHLNPNIPAAAQNGGLPGGSDSGRPTVSVPPGGTPSNHPGDLTDLYTNVLTPIFQGLSEQSAFGEKVAITLYDATDPYNVKYIGGYDPSQGSIATNPTFNNLANQTDAYGNFSVQVNAGVWTAQISDGVKVIRVQATDQAGTSGNLADFTFTLDTTAPIKLAAAPTLDPNSDSGLYNNDNYTNVVKPFIDFTPTEGNITVYLLRKPAGAPDTSYAIVNTMDLPPLLNGASPVPTKIQDPGTLTDGQYVYAIQEIDPAGNLGPISDPSAVITIDTAAPVAPTQLRLDPLSDTGVQGDNVTSITNPIIDVQQAEGSPSQVYLLRNGVLVPSATGPGALTNPRSGPGAIQDPGTLADGTYSYTAYSVDLAGNVGTASSPLKVRILHNAPQPAPTVALYPDDDSGVKGDNATNVRQPRLYGTAPVPPPEGYTIQLVQVQGSTYTVLATTPDPNTGNYVIQFPSPLPDGQITVQIRVVDIAGNYTASNNLTLTINGTPPNVTPTLYIDPADDTGLPGDNKTTSRKPRIDGVTTPGGIVDILDANNNLLATTIALTTAANGHPAGFFQTQLPLVLSNGTITIYARVRDSFGNVNPNLGTLTMTIYTAAYDFTNSGAGQYAVYSPSSATWNIITGPGTQINMPYGWAGHDIPMPADYTGAGSYNIAVFRPDTDTWYINRGTGLGQYNVQWGWVGHDTPVPADYTGDGKADIAVYRPSTAQWYILGSNMTVPVVQFGWANHDKPVPADYLNTGATQIAVWRPETGQWFIRNPANGSTSIVQLGQTGDIPEPGDYDGIGYAEEAVYRPSTGQYIIYNPITRQTRTVNVGAANSSDVPVPADYDGDGKTDPAVYRPNASSTQGAFRVVQSSNGQLITTNYGAALSDVAIAGPLSYRVAAINGPVGTPAATSEHGGTFVSQVSAGQITTPATVNTSTMAPITSAASAPAVVVGAVTPGAGARKNGLTRVTSANPTNANANHSHKHHNKHVVKTTHATKNHPMNKFDSLLEQLSQEGLKHKANGQI